MANWGKIRLTTALPSQGNFELRGSRTSTAPCVIHHILWWVLVQVQLFQLTWLRSCLNQPQRSLLCRGVSQRCVGGVTIWQPQPCGQNPIPLFMLFLQNDSVHPSPCPPTYLLSHFPYGLDACPIKVAIVLSGLDELVALNVLLHLLPRSHKVVISAVHFVLPFRPRGVCKGELALLPSTT